MSAALFTHSLDDHACEEARLSRDERFDGLFFIGVTSTGIFCRSICPARPAKRENVQYFSSAAAASAAGFRPCLRCRPERAPGSPSWHLGNDLVSGALRLIDEGVLDDAPVATLAEKVGVSERHLRRLFTTTLGANPAQLAATRRLLFAKQLLAETSLSVTDVALASGYGSLRRFNAAFRAACDMSPRATRRTEASPERGVLRLRLPYRAPFDFDAILEFFARRALPGVETVTASTYRRHFILRGAPGVLEVSHRAADAALELRVHHPAVRVLPDLAARIRRMFDLDADPAAVARVLARDPQLACMLKRHPGLRLPRGWDGFEIAVRAILGQQISVAGARTLAGRLVERWGASATLPDGTTGRFLPSAETLADQDLASIGLTRRRAATLTGVAQAVRDGRVGFQSEQGLDAFIDRWTALSGIGPWTAHYIAMRALGHPDAFPAADLVLRQVAGGDTPVTARSLEARSQAWRPWRAYATVLMWRSATD